MAPSLLAIVQNQFYALFPPKPHFTEAEVGDLTGKVYIVTGSSGGVGKALAEILYSKNAKVYVAARSEDKSQAAIADIKAAHPTSKGQLVFLRLDLADLTTIKASAAEFLAREKKLHVLFNNAGVMTPPQGSKTTQGYELQLGTNNVGAFLFTKLLTPILVSTARSLSASAAFAGTVRVVWVSSSAAEAFSPTSGGVELDNLDYHKDRSAIFKYGVSKAGNYLHSAEFARRFRADGVVSLCANPGNLHSDLTRHQPWVVKFFLKTFILYPTINGAYTELFCGLSPDVGLEQSGRWVQPWGRFDILRPDLLAASKLKSEGGTGVAEKFWEWSEEQIKPYL